MLTEKLQHLELTGAQPSVLVIGDLMIDQYITGSATRLSPEAPVPVVNVVQESATLGGAGNVVQNLVSLGAKVAVAGVVGNDSAAEEIKTMLNDEGVLTDALLKDPLRLTTVKTRILAGNHQLLRFDKEHLHALPEELENRLTSSIEAMMNSNDIIVLSDYNKGLFSPSLCKKIMEAASANGKKVVIDPKGDNYRKYKGAFIIKPNRHELALAAKTGPVNSVETLREAANVIFEQTDVQYLIVTLSEEGMVLLGRTSMVTFPVKARQVFDVTGAGDTVMATITYFLVSGFTLEEACELANHAASIVIRRIGSATTNISEIIEDIELSIRENKVEIN